MRLRGETFQHQAQIVGPSLGRDHKTFFTEVSVMSPPGRKTPLGR